MTDREPKPPEGYRWVPKGQIVWPSDVFKGVSALVPVPRTHEWEAAWCDYHYLRSKITQPDLAWLKAAAVKHVESLTDHIEKEKGRYAIAQAVKVYSDALRKLVPEREQWRPDQRLEVGQ